MKIISNSKEDLTKELIFLESCPKCDSKLRILGKDLFRQKKIGSTYEISYQCPVCKSNSTRLNSGMVIDLTLEILEELCS